MKTFSSLHLIVVSLATAESRQRLEIDALWDVDFHSFVYMILYIIINAPHPATSPPKMVATELFP
ncbi:hypothetical protein AB833_06020 [Chromatiales bacterium (ex Bugula neritina AB1)]|nr:hypothetical protein AB833_06020 [Chromatiales bacterium (ex Bugula neritina AB1)]